MKIYKFDFGAQIVDDLQEHEFGPYQYRALFTQGHRGDVTIHSIERKRGNDWDPTGLGPDVVGMIECILFDEWQREQRRIYQQHEEERFERVSA
jgi:hypothetical protein